MSIVKQGARAVPTLRFPEFRKENSWQDGTVADYAKVVAGQSPDGAYYNELREGLPFYQGKSDFGEIFLEKPQKWTSHVTKRAEAGDIVMSVRAPVGALNVTTEEICIGRGLAAIQAKGSKWFLYYLLNSISPSIIGNGGSVFDSINKDQIEKLRVFVPQSAAEQQKIADCLTSLDEVIAAQARIVEALKAHKRGLMQQLFPREGETRPRLRFPEFRDSPEWEEKEIGDVFRVTRGEVLAMPLVKNDQSSETPYPVYSSQTKNGGLAGYFSEFLYEDAITWTTDGANAGEVNYRAGKFYCTNVCGVLLSNDGYANPFVAALLNTVARNHVSYVGNPKLMNGVMARITIPFPSLAEQQRIASCLSSLDTQITAETRQLAALKTHKQGLMQQLFPAPEAA